MNRISPFVILIFIFSIQILAQNRYACESGEVLFGGYDPVSYFTFNPAKGDSSIFTIFQGRYIQFASVENKERFDDNPEKYLPGYGGWCAHGMSDGVFFQPDYSSYKIQNHQLLFFRQKIYLNGLSEWNKNPNNNKMKADLIYDKYFVK